MSIPDKKIVAGRGDPDRTNTNVVDGQGTFMPVTFPSLAHRMISRLAWDPALGYYKERI